MSGGRTPGKSKILVALLLIAIVAVAIPDFVQYWRESGNLAAVARQLAHGAETTEETVSRVVEATKERVVPVTDGAFYKVGRRPLLRHTAWQTWSNREGLCGEGSRVIVNLLRSLGIPATRINLINESDGFYHTAVAYRDRGDWWLVDSVNSVEGFYGWTRWNRRPVGELVAARMDPGGALLISSSNPYFTRFSYFNWARVFGVDVEINQRIPFPGAVVEVLENPPLFRALVKLALAALVVAAAAGVYSIVRRARRLTR